MCLVSSARAPGVQGTKVMVLARVVGMNRWLAWSHHKVHQPAVVVRGDGLLCKAVLEGTPIDQVCLNDATETDEACGECELQALKAPTCVMLSTV